MQAALSVFAVCSPTRHVVRRTLGHARTSDRLVRHAWDADGMADGAQLTSVVTAGAAACAAVLSAVTLWITGRRGETAWLRSALIDALEHYAQASWLRRRTVREILAARTRGVTQEEWEQLRATRRERHRQQTDRLTRLRLLAANPVVRAAEELLMHDDAMENEFTAATTGPTAEELVAFAQRQVENDSMKAAFVAACRRSLGVRGGVGIDPRLQGYLQRTDDSPARAEREPPLSIGLRHEADLSRPGVGGHQRDGIPDRRSPEAGQKGDIP
jgi:hypothetical protein